MNRGLKYIILLIVLVLISGAQGCERKAGVGAGAYIGGVDGLGISFVADEPPAKILDNNQEAFFITLALENRGEYDIPKGKVIGTISGIPKADFSMGSLNTKSANVIEGRHKVGGEVIEGITDEIRFEEAKYKYDLSADLLQKMRVDVCYVYSTEGLAKLCLKKNPSERSEADICRINNEAIDLESSSGPVKITNVREQSAGSSEVLIMFDVENVGGGEVYLPDAFSSRCFYQDRSKDQVKINVRPVAGNVNVKCSAFGDSSGGNARLANNKRKITCRVSTSGLQDTAFESPINIKLDYFYKVSLYKELLIENI